MSDAAAPNAAQIEYWNTVSGPKWVALDDVINAQIEPMGEAALGRAEVRADDRVIDVGCGCGPTSLELARRSARGRVTGVDISGPMLERARERAEEAGLSHLSFERADAQTHAFEPGGADLVFSRFGVMFFADPVAAFANLGRALASDGRLVFACWQGIGDNPWMRVPVAAVAQVVEMPGGPPPDPHAPGPFAFADRARTEKILTDAGFADVEIEPAVRKLALGTGMGFDETIDFVLQMGPASAVLGEADDATRKRAHDAVSAALEPYYEGDAVRIEAAAWIVRASGYVDQSSTKR